jgi:diguanylate cyclase (GGDEF)-like protein
MVLNGLGDLDPKAAEIPDGVWRRLCFLFFPDSAYTDAKFQDHRAFSAIIMIFISLLFAGFWFWDYVIDPINAKSTIGLRLLFLLYLLTVPVILSPKFNRRFFEVTTIPLLLAGQTLFCAILSMLETGTLYGLGGFMYSLFAVLFTTQCFTLRYGIVSLVSISALPHLLALMGLPEGFMHVHYAILIWPGTIFAILTQALLAHHYLVRYSLEQQHKSLSLTDHLTGVPNRRYFTQFFEQNIMQAQRSGEDISLLLLDIDFFKQINDTYGHLTGDLVLRRLTQCIVQEAARSIDVIARVGGEEFAIVLPGTSATHAAAVAERIRARVEEEEFHSVDNQAFHISVSIGVAELNDSDSKYTDTISRADEALYRAKSRGRNMVVVNNSGQENITSKLTTEFA